MAVVTVRGRHGAMAHDIGQLLAEELHAEYADGEIIRELARRLETDPTTIALREFPRRGPLARLEEVVRRMAATEPAVELTPAAPPVLLSDDHYVEGLRDVIGRLAQLRSVVIMGRGSQFILRSDPRAFHVFVTAPLEVRIQRTMQALEVDADTARKEIERVDTGRKEFARRYFKSKWDDSASYHLTVNTGGLSVESAVRVIVRAIAQGYEPLATPDQQRS